MERPLYPVMRPQQPQLRGDRRHSQMEKPRHRGPWFLPSKPSFPGVHPHPPEKCIACRAKPLLAEPTGLTLKPKTLPGKWGASMSMPGLWPAPAPAP